MSYIPPHRPFTAPGGSHHQQQQRVDSNNSSGSLTPPPARTTTHPSPSNSNPRSRVITTRDGLVYNLSPRTVSNSHYQTIISPQQPRNDIYNAPRPATGNYNSRSSSSSATVNQLIGRRTNRILQSLSRYGGDETGDLVPDLPQQRADVVEDQTSNLNDTPARPVVEQHHHPEEEAEEQHIVTYHVPPVVVETVVLNVIEQQQHDTPPMKQETQRDDQPFSFSSSSAPDAANLHSTSTGSISFNNPKDQQQRRKGSSVTSRRSSSQKVPHSTHRRGSGMPVHHVFAPNNNENNNDENNNEDQSNQFSRSSTTTTTLQQSKPTSAGGLVPSATAPNFAGFGGSDVLFFGGRNNNNEHPTAGAEFSNDGSADLLQQNTSLALSGAPSRRWPTESIVEPLEPLDNHGLFQSAEIDLVSDDDENENDNNTPAVDEQNTTKTLSYSKFFNMSVSQAMKLVRRIHAKAIEEFRTSSRSTAAGETSPNSSTSISVVESASSSKGNMNSWNFDAFEWATQLGGQMVLFEEVALFVGEKWGIFEDMSHATVKKDIFVNFVRKLGPLYRDVPFHSLIQAADRTQALYHMLTNLCKQSILDSMDGLERTALLVSSLAADVGHPGRTNSFLVAIRDPVSVRYNGLHVLENFHVATLFSTLQTSATDITQDFNDANNDLAAFHNMCCKFILSTELARNKFQVDDFEKRITSGALDPWNNVSHRYEVLGLLLHSADVCNVARVPLVAAKFSRAVQLEFEAQGDDEETRGLPITTGMQAGIADRAKLTVDFIDSYGGPLFDAIGKLLVNDAPPVKQLTRNRSVLAAQVGAGSQTKSRWPQHSIVEPCMKTNWKSNPLLTGTRAASVRPGSALMGSPRRDGKEDSTFDGLGGEETETNDGVDDLEPEKLRVWNFDAFAEAERMSSPMALFEGVAVRIAEEMMLFKSDSSPTGVFTRDKFRRFARKLGSFYRPNFYHSLIHAADVTQATYALLMMTNPPLLPRMDGVERAALLISAMSHDVGHPGRNNMFLNNIRDPVAVRYNGQSVLENFHVATLFSLLRDRDVDITEDLSTADLARFHSLCCTFILGTDMSKHKVHVDDFDHRITSGALRPVDDANDRKVIFAVLLHAADIGNPTRPPEIAAKWDKAVQEEFWAQGDEEKERGLPVSFGCSRDVTDAGRSRGTLFFVDNYVLPLMEALAKIMRPDAPVVESTLKNRSAIAAAAGLPQIQRSRWPTTSIVEPIQVQNIKLPPADAPNQLADDPNILDWNFDAFEHASKLGSHFALFEQLGLMIGDRLELFSSGVVSRSSFQNFIRKLGPMYRDLPYHNMLQAADRVQALFSLLELTEPPLLPKLDIVERTALLAVALGSDVGHPGRTNSFLIAIRDPVAIRYNRVNVLENFHAATLFSLLRETSCDITISFSEEQLDRFHDLACTFIMTTNLAQSTEQINIMQQRLTSGNLRPHENAQDRKEVLALFLHVADISNPGRPPLVGAKWARRVQQEFEAQGDEELRRGLPVSHGMSRDCDRARFLVHFMEAFALPLFEALSPLLKKKSAPVEQMIANHLVLAAQAGMDVSAKSRWPQHSIVEPCVVTEYSSEANPEAESFLSSTSSSMPKTRMLSEESLLSDEARALITQKLKKWNFDAFAECEALGSPMKLFEQVTMTIAEEMMLFKSDSSPTGVFTRDKFRRFARKLGSFYRPNFYHSLIHAADVTQATYALLMMTNPPLLPRMDGVERAALLISAMSHDVGHPGRNNMFLNNIRDPVAVRYNGQSVLENFHVATLFSLLRDRDVDITEDLSTADLARFHSLCCTFILGTDMSKHKVHVDDFDHRITSGALRPVDDANDRKVIFAVLLHAADIGNPTRPPEIAAKWDKAVQEEFWAQGDEEKERGLPVSFGCSRDVTDAGRSRSTLFFVDNYVLPLMEALAKIMRPDAPVVESTLKNRSAIAAAAGLPQIQRSRWPTSSIVEPIQVQTLPKIPQGSQSFNPSKLADWHFDAFSWASTVGSQYELFIQIAMRVAGEWKIFSSSDLEGSPFSHKGSVDRATFERFVKKLAPLYRDLPYHNAAQASDRLQALYSLLSMTDPPLLPRLDPIERTSLIVAALSSDIAHPGRTNEFLVAIRDPVAIRYNSLNVLENFHLATLFELLRSTDLDITLPFSECELFRFHSLVCMFIMSTDLTKHTSQIQDFDNRLTSAELRPYTNDRDRSECLAVFFHCADICNPARPQVVAAKFSRAIQLEFSAQHEDEVKRGLTTVDARTEKGRDYTKNQVKFIDAFTLPIFHAISKLLGSNTEPIEMVEKNRSILAAQVGML